MTNLSELETTPEVGDEKLSPAGAATLIADFVDVLIPGERLWPSASAVGVQGQLALRLMEERGKNALPTLVKAIEAAGGPLEGLDEAARVAVVRRFEEAEPDLFGWVRDAVFFAYYETPSSPPPSTFQGASLPAICGLIFAKACPVRALPTWRTRCAAAWPRRLCADAIRSSARRLRPRSRQQPHPGLGTEAMKKNDPCDILIIGAGATRHPSPRRSTGAHGGLDSSASSRAPGSRPGKPPALQRQLGLAAAQAPAWNADVNKRHHPDDYPVVTSDSSQVLMWNGVGGSTNVYGAIWPRYRPSDFRKGDEHGLQPNWPIAYEDLAPYYEEADRSIGVSGLAGDPAMPSREACPTEYLPFTEGRRAALRKRSTSLAGTGGRRKPA